MMVKKRKSLASSLDEVDRSMFSTFSGAANSLSQLYTQAMNQQKLSFLAGERHGMEKLYQWMLRQQEGASRVTTVDILNYLQSELDYNGEDQPVTPRPQSQNQHSQPIDFANSGLLVSTGSISLSASGHGVRTDHEQPSKNYVFSNALSSPVRRSLQNYHNAPGGYFSSNVQPSNGARNNETNSIDASMDMHSDSPVHDSTY